MKSLVCTILCLAYLLPTTAQVYWQGGTPGKEQDWYTSLNWSNNKVPDSMDDVVIPNVSSTTKHYPTINAEIENIQSLFLAADAELHILPEGSLQIDGSDTYNEGIRNLGQINNEGIIVINNTGMPNTTGSMNNILGNGDVFVDGLTIRGTDMLTENE